MKLKRTSMGLLDTSAGLEVGRLGMARRPSRSARIKWIAVAIFVLLTLVLAGPVFSEITDADVAGLGPGTADSPTTFVEPPSMMAYVFRLIVSIGFVFALIFIAARLARKYLPNQTGAGRGGGIEILTTRSIGQRKNLLLVRVADKTVLLGTTAQSVQFLADVDQGVGGWDEAAVQSGLRDLEVAGKP